MMNRKLMKRDRVRNATKAVATVALVHAMAAAGCSLIVDGLVVPEETTPTGGSAGTGGAGGASGGMGGFAGSPGGAGGTVVQGGSGGTTTQGGNGGQAAHAGEGGEAGFGGFGGEAGAGGSAGGAAGGGGSGTVCPGVFDESIIGQAFYVSTPKPVGGYEIINQGEGGGGITVNIECAATHALVDQGVFCQEGGPETQVSVTVDGKRIRLTNLASDATLANMNAIVEPL